MLNIYEGKLESVFACSPSQAVNPKSESEIKKNLIEEYSDVIQCARELGLQPDEEQIKEKAERFKVRWIAKIQSDVAKKAKVNKKNKNSLQKWQ